MWSNYAGNASAIRNRQCAQCAATLRRRDSLLIPKLRRRDSQPSGTNRSPRIHTRHSGTPRARTDRTRTIAHQPTVTRFTTKHWTSGRLASGRDPTPKPLVDQRSFIHEHHAPSFHRSRRLLGVDLLRNSHSQSLDAQPQCIRQSVSLWRVSRPLVSALLGYPVQPL